VLAAAAISGDGNEASRLRLDVGLIAVAYSGFMVTGVSFYRPTRCS
jgi:hypothetical protein